MRTLIFLLAALLAATPALAGSLTMTTTDQSGKTNTVHKQYPDSDTVKQKAAQARTDTQGAFETIVRQIGDLDKAMTGIVDAFKDDAKKLQ